MKDFLLILGIIAHFVLIGADIFGQIVISPVVLSAPPASLAIFQGEYAYNSTVFWQPANMVALALLIVALIANWNTPRRALLVGWFVGSVRLPLYRWASFFRNMVPSYPRLLIRLSIQRWCSAVRIGGSSRFCG